MVVFCMRGRLWRMLCSVRCVVWCEVCVEYVRCVCACALEKMAMNLDAGAVAPFMNLDELP